MRHRIHASLYRGRDKETALKSDSTRLDSTPLDSPTIPYQNELLGRSVPSRPSANARGGAIDAVRGWCAGLGRGVKRLTAAIVHASSAASEVRDVEHAHTGHRRRGGAVGVEAGRRRRAPPHFCTMHFTRCGGAGGAEVGETSPSRGVPTLGPRLYNRDDHSLMHSRLWPR